MSYFEFENRTKLCAGAHALEHLPYECAIRDAKRPLLLTDPNLNRLGLPKQVSRAAEGLDLSRIFDAIPQDSSVTVVAEAAAFYREHQCDSLIALGGGSVLDTAKGVALVIDGQVNNPMELIGYEAQSLTNHIPFFAIPTTAGTGSEATSVAVIAEPTRERKLEFVTAALCPDAAFLDPRMTEALPIRITASTGMDALCHALEAYTCLQKNPVSDGLALAAIRLIVRALPALMKKPGDQAARMDMATASYLAGSAFSNSMVGGVHAIGHALGGVCHLAHGDAMNILLPHVMTFNLDTCRETYSELLLFLAGPDIYAQTPASVRAEAAIQAIRDLQQHLHEASGLPLRLEETGRVKQTDLEHVARKATQDGALLYNPRAMSREQILTLLHSAW